MWTIPTRFGTGHGWPSMRGHYISRRAWTSSTTPPSRTPSGKPLAERMRPRRLEDFAGQEHVLGPGTALRRAIEADQVPSLILWGPPGHRARRRSRASSRSGPAPSSSPSARCSAGVKEIREIVAAARERRRMHRKRTILFVDEIHRFTKAQQDAFLPARRGRDGDARRRHHREPVLRGERGAPLALPGGDAARPHRGGGRARSSTARVAAPEGLAGTVRARARTRARRSPATPTATRAGRSNALEVGRRARSASPGATDDRAAPTPRRRSSRRRSSTTRRARSTTTSSPPSSSRCAAPTRTPPSTTWCGCSRAARTRASCCGAW